MLTKEKLEAVKLFGEGRRYYKAMDFVKAEGFFLKALEICPEDKPSKVYLDRCRYYMEFPPPADWDGVYVMKTK